MSCVKYSVYKNVVSYVLYDSIECPFQTGWETYYSHYHWKWSLVHVFAVIPADHIDSCEVRMPYWSGVFQYWSNDWGKKTNQVLSRCTGPLQLLQEENPRSNFWCQHIDVPCPLQVVKDVDSKELRRDSLNFSPTKWTWPCPTWLLRQMAPYIAPTICQLCNISMECGVFPIQLKQACILPLLKKSSRIQTFSYPTVLFLTCHTSPNLSSV